MSDTKGDWRNEFSSSALRQGKEYYLSGKAKRLTVTDTGYTAVVRGTRNFQVTIDADGDELYDMSCTCEDSADGSCCGHMAAALFLIEETYGKMYLAEEDEYNDDSRNDPAASSASAYVQAGSGRPVPVRPEKETRSPFYQLEELQSEGRRLVEEQADSGPELGREEYRYFH